MKNLIILILILSQSHLISQVIDEAEFQDKIKCGTHIKNQKRKDNNNKRLDNFLRPKLQKSISSKSGLFLLHFDTTGINAVDNIDLNKNLIPDYIDSALEIIEYVYEIECNQIGYRTQLSDSGIGGTDATDIYFTEIGKGDADNVYYGWTKTELEILGGNSKNPKFTSFINLDNNYSIKDSTIINDTLKRQSYITNGIEALKVTFAHEYHHVIQSIYGNFNENSLLHEMSATYMEYRVYPEIKDYMQYIKKLFAKFSKYPFGTGESTSGYSYSSYGIYLYHKYGDKALKRMWELSEKGFFGLNALDSATKPLGFTNTFCDFMSWCYFTGKRTGLGESFPNASEFPEITFNTKKWNKTNQYSFENTISAYEIMPLRITTPAEQFSRPDSIDIMFTNTNFKKALSNSFDFEVYNLEILDNNNSSDFIKIPNTKYYYKVDNTQYFCNSINTLKGPSSECIDFAFPNPLDLSSNKLYLPVECSIIEDTKVQVDIYDIEHKSIYSDLQKVIVFNNQKVVLIESLPENISTGNYIFITSQNDKNVIGKFSIIKKN